MTQGYVNATKGIKGGRPSGKIQKKKRLNGATTKKKLDKKGALREKRKKKAYQEKNESLIGEDGSPGKKGYYLDGVGRGKRTESAIEERTRDRIAYQRWGGRSKQ